MLLLVVLLFYSAAIPFASCRSRTRAAEMAKKVIAVVGATRVESIALVRAIVDEGDLGEFSVRAFTHDKPYTDNVKWMKYRGVDVRDVDVEDETALTKALDGVYGLYAATFYWAEHLDPDKELNQAKNLANAAKIAGVKHVIWLTAEDTRSYLENVPTLMAHYKVPSFDAKAEADRYFTEAGLPTTFLVLPFLWDNFLNTGMGPRKSSANDEKWEIVMPMGSKQLPGIASEDVGKCALAIFKNRDQYINKRVTLAGDHVTVGEIAEKMTNALKTPIDYKEISFDEYRRLNEPNAVELGNMFQFYYSQEQRISHSIEESKKLNPELMNFDQWLQKYKDYIPLRSF